MFISTKSLLLVLALITGSQAIQANIDTAPNAGPGNEYYEYRIYKCSSQDQQDAVATFLHDALIPAYHRHGIEVVGAFVPTDSDNGYDVHTLVPMDGLEDFHSLYRSIYADARFIVDANDFNSWGSKDSAAYDRINSKLMIAFHSMPSLVLPASDDSDRVFEIRSYESATMAQGMRKVHMFNQGGEVPIFEDLGFQPVFFAEAITGDELPNLVYMVAYDDAEERDDFWKAFQADPRWAAIKDLPQYKGTVSKIHSHMVKPIKGSDIK